jgi:hypothetical protein
VKRFQMQPVWPEANADRLKANGPEERPQKIIWTMYHSWPVVRNRGSNRYFKRFRNATDTVASILLNSLGVLIMNSCFSRGWPFLNGCKVVASHSGISSKLKIGVTRFLMSVFFFTLFSANAATWYVDSAAGGANNGTSWANAWTSISSATGSSVKAGDTVYISGGAAGNTQTYSGFVPKAGTSGSPITYQIGQDSSHNGTATFSGGGTWLNNPSYCIVSGDAGDGQMHFALSGYSQILTASSSSSVNYRLSYMNFGTINNMHLVDCTAGQGVEFDHNWLKSSSTDVNADYVFGWNNDQPPAAYDSGLKFHNNVLFSPCSSGGLGEDGLRMEGVGWSVYNNYLCGYSNPGSQEHQDGLQDWQQGSYIKIYNNIVQDFNNAGLNVSAYTAAYSHVRMYNNLIVFTSANASSYSEGGFVGLAASGFTMVDCIVANNIIAGGSQGWSMNNSGGYSVTWTGCFIENNISVQGVGVQADTANGVIAADNVDNMSASTAASYFKTYANSLNGTNNNFRLTAAATSLIGKGANLTAYGITTDMDGNARPATGNWDIGPFQYGSSGSNINPVISASPASLNFASINGANVTNTLSVRNTGGGTLTGTASVPAPFQIVAGGSYNLAANQSQNVTVSYIPSGGSTNRVITLTGGGGASVPVSGSTASASPPTVSPITQSGADVDSGTSGLQIYAGSVVQYSGSASDPNSFPLTWQWIYTVNGGSEIVVTNGAGTVASVSFSYNGGTVGNTYVWKLRVNNGYATAESDLTVGVEAPPVANGVVFPATSGTITAPFVVSGNYIYQSVETTTPATGGSAYYNFTVTNAGIYVIQALVNAPSMGANSFYVNMDAMPQDPTMIWDIPITTGFEQQIVSWRGTGTDGNDQFVPEYFNLTQGAHQLVIIGREANVQLQTVAVLPVPPPPQNLRIMSP